MAVKNNLKTGDRVKLFIDGKEEKVCVVKQADENSFKVDAELFAQVFVYGKEVNDFHSVDYEALSTLNISATQELLKLIKQQQEQIEELKASNKKSEDRLTAIEALLQNGTGQFNNTSSTTVKASVK